MKAPAWRTLSQLLLFLLALLLFWWTLRAIQLNDLRQLFQQLTLSNLAILVLANLVVLITLCGRWWLFLAGAGYPIPYWRLLGYRTAAFAVSYFTPGPHMGGEPLQVYLVSKRHGVPTAVAIATVTLDKLLEMVSNLLVLGAGLAFVLQQSILVNTLSPKALYLAFGLVLLPLPVLAALYYGRHALAHWLAPLHRRNGRPRDASTLSTRLEGWLQTIAQSEAQISALWRNSPQIFLAACFVSVLSWGALVGEFWYMTYTLGLGLSLRGAVTFLLAMRVAMLLPLPAGLGAVEASLTVAAAALGLPPVAGLGLSLLIRLRDVSLGMIGLWLGGGALWRPAPVATPAVATLPSETGFQVTPLCESWPREDAIG